MNVIATSSIGSDSNPPIDAVRVENPPVATDVKMWLIASHGVIPASRGGKLKAFSQNCAVALYVLPLAGAAASLRAPVMAVAVVATVVTGLDYALGARRAAAERARG